MIVERALLPRHGLDGAWHGGGLERGRAVGMQGVADGVDGGEGPLGGQRESFLMLRLLGRRWVWGCGGGGGRKQGRERKKRESEEPVVTGSDMKEAAMNVYKEVTFIKVINEKKKF